MIHKLRAFDARKSLGQNFLHDENIARKIVEAIKPKPGELIVEVGPGFGILTAHLVASGCRYIGIEIDQRLVPDLRARFRADANAEIRQGDFRQLALDKLRDDPGRIRIVGNIPYHITSSILFAAFQQHAHVEDMVLMLQREVAERVIARPATKDYGILSVLSQTFALPKVQFYVSPNVFIPRPGVASAVVRWDFQQAAKPAPVDTDYFIEFVKKLFQQRRKTLRNVLKTLLGGQIPESALAMDLQRRAETLQVAEVIALANSLFCLTRTATS